MKKRVVFRADGNQFIGLGHIVRSLALADLIKNKFDILYAVQSPSDVVLSMIKKVTADIFILPVETNYDIDCINFLKYLSSTDMVVTDGYFFTDNYQLKIKKHGCQLVCIDDIHTNHFYADAVINHAGGVFSGDYSAEPYSKFYLGVKYAMLRKPFLDATEKIRSIKKTDSAFVCLGGSDQFDLLLKILGAISENQYIKNIHVLTASPSLTADIEKNIPAVLNKKLKMHFNLSAEEICTLISNCNVAVTSASTVAYECCAVGIPLFTGYYTGNQSHLYQFLIKEQLAFPLGDLTIRNCDELKTFNPEVIRNLNHLNNQRKFFNPSIISNCEQIFLDL